MLSINSETKKYSLERVPNYLRGARARKIHRGGGGPPNLRGPTTQQSNCRKLSPRQGIHDARSTGTYNSPSPNRPIDGRRAARRQTVQPNSRACIVQVHTTRLAGVPCGDLSVVRKKAFQAKSVPVQGVVLAEDALESHVRLAVRLSAHAAQLHVARLGNTTGRGWGGYAYHAQGFR